MQMSNRQANSAQKAINMMEYDKFQRLADGFIDRSSHEFGEMPASIFFELLFEKMAGRVTEPVELQAEIVDKRLIKIGSHEDLS
jgi:hypothetical protein